MKKALRRLPDAVGVVVLEHAFVEALLRFHEIGVEVRIVVHRHVQVVEVLRDGRSGRIVGNSSTIR